MFVNLTEHSKWGCVLLLLIRFTVIEIHSYHKQASVAVRKQLITPRTTVPLFHLWTYFVGKVSKGTCRIHSLVRVVKSFLPNSPALQCTASIPRDVSEQEGVSRFSFLSFPFPFPFLLFPLYSCVSSLFM